MLKTWEPPARGRGRGGNNVSVSASVSDDRKQYRSISFIIRRLDSRITIANIEDEERERERNEL